VGRRGAAGWGDHVRTAPHRAVSALLGVVLLASSLACRFTAPPLLDTTPGGCVARHIDDEGTGRERIVLIGEAPGRWEEHHGRPFVGPSGALLSQWHAGVGLTRRDIYWTNVYPYRPPSNEINAIPDAELYEWVAKLHDRIARLDDPYILVPTGNTALKALLGKDSILKHRGSLYEYVDRRGRRIKVCATLHPAAVLRQPYWAKRCRRDWERIAAEALTRTVVLPAREHLIAPTLDDVHAFVESASHADVLALDIETPRERVVTTPTYPWSCTACGQSGVIDCAAFVEGFFYVKKGAVKGAMHINTSDKPCGPITTGAFTKSGALRKGRESVRYGDARITCVGFAIDANFSITIPTTLAHWKSERRLRGAWDAIRTLCTSDVPKAMQNGLFDTWWLAQRDYAVGMVAWEYDTLAMHHALDSAEDHDLAFMASVDTREPYWKDEAKDPDEAARYLGAGIEAFWRYNGKDVAVTWELADVYATRLRALDRFDFYRDNYRALYAPLLQLMLEGVRVDQQARHAQLTNLQATSDTVAAKLADLAGVSLFGPKGSLSAQRLAKYLYDELKLPRQTKGRGEKPATTTDEITIRRLRQRYPKFKPAADMILDHRRATKLASFLKEDLVDADDRVRCSYKFTTEFSRLASSKNPGRTGLNLQNVDREARSIFVPDDGHVFVEVDLSQAEFRVLAVLTGDPQMIALAQSKPWEFDIHRYNAGIIFAKAESAVTPPERYLAKRAVHAADYGMHGKKLSELLMLEDTIVTQDYAQRLIDAYLNHHEPIRKWQARTRMLVMRDRVLSNSWGDVFSFADERLDDDTYRRAYACVPQSEVARLLNRRGLVPLWNEIRTLPLRSRIRLQVHDALVVSCAPDEAWLIYDYLRLQLERTRVYRGVPLSIPADVKLGWNWAPFDAASNPTGMREFKRPPSQEEFNAACRRDTAAA
jgi:uracil-DNA glycosylase family 4